MNDFEVIKLDNGDFEVKEIKREVDKYQSKENCLKSDHRKQRGRTAPSKCKE